MKPDVRSLIADERFPTSAIRLFFCCTSHVSHYLFILLFAESKAILDQASGIITRHYLENGTDSL